MSDDSDVEVRVGIDATESEAGASEAAAALKQIEAAVQQLNATTKAGTAEMTAAFRGMSSQLQSAASQTSSSMGSMANSVRNAGGALEQTAHSSTALRRELIVMAHESITGNFTRLGGSVMVLAERWQALGAVLANPVTWGFAAAAAAAGLLIAASIQANQEEAHLANMLSLTGQYAGITSSQFREMAQQVGGQTTTSVAAARNVLMQLASTGRFTGDEIQQLGTVTTRFAQMSGESTSKIVEGWVRLADSPSRYAEEFSRQFHGAISAAQLQHIEELERMGDKEGALAAAVKDLSQWMNGQSEAVDGVTGRFRVWGQTIGDVTDKLTVMFHLRPQSNGEQLAQVNSEIAQAERLGQTAEGRRNVVGGAGDMAQFDAYLARLEQQRTMLMGVASVDQAAASAQAEHNRIQQAANDVMDKSHQTMRSLRSSAEEAAEAVKDLNAQMAARIKANPGDSEAKDYFANQQKYDDALRRRVDRADNKPGADQVQLWTEQLQQMETKSGDFFNDETQMELSFWQGKLSSVQANSKQYVAIEAKIYEDEKRLAHEAYDAQIADDKEKLASAKGSVEQTQAAIDKYMADVGAKYHQDSTQYIAAQKESTQALKAALQERAKAQQQADEEQLHNDTKAADASFEAAKGDIEKQEQLVQQRERLGQESATRAATEEGALHQQLYAAEVAHENQIYALKEAELQKELAIANLAPAQMQAINKKIEEDFANHQEVLAKLAQENSKRMAQDQATAAEAAQRAWMQPLSKIGNEFTTMTVGMINGSNNTRAQLLRIGTQMETDAVGWIVKQGEKFIANEMVKVTATAAGATSRTSIEAAASAQSHTLNFMDTVKAVTNAAVKAAAGAYAAMAGIPIIGPELGAVAAGVTFAAVETLGAMASAAGGWDRVPEDQIAQLHKEEMVLPASISVPLRSAIDTGNFAGGAGGGGPGGGDTHIHNWHLNAVDGKDVQSFFDKHQDKIVKTLKSATRKGAKIGSG